MVFSSLSNSFLDHLGDIVIFGDVHEVGLVIKDGIILEISDLGSDPATEGSTYNRDTEGDKKCTELSGTLLPGSSTRLTINRHHSRECIVLLSSSFSESR